MITFLHDDGLIVPFSVRTKLRNAAPGFSFASSYFLRCLYLKERGDPTSPQVGFLQGPLLVRVRFRLCIHSVHLTIALFQAYQHIFTSPSSASGENSKSEPTARRRDVATMLRMDCRVTRRAIAYAATQVSRPLQINSTSFANSFFSKLVHALSSAPEWPGKRRHAGFHLPTLYNFIIDIFEDPESETAKRSAEELLQWWNRYV